VKKAIVGLRAGDAFTITRTFIEGETSVVGDTNACVFTIREVCDWNRASWGETAGNLHGEYSSDAAFPRDGANQ